MDENTDLWKEVGAGCLIKALKLLKQETTPTTETVNAVKALVDTAIAIDECDFRWKNTNPFAR